MAVWVPTPAIAELCSGRTAQGRLMEALHSRIPLGRVGVREKCKIHAQFFLRTRCTQPGSVPIRVYFDGRTLRFRGSASLCCCQPAGGECRVVVNRG